MSASEIGTIKGCSSRNVIDHLHRKHIHVRSFHQTNLVRKYKPQQKYDWSDLKELYIIQKLSVTAIATIKHCSTSAVDSAMKRLIIKGRNKSEAQRLVIDSGKKTIHFGAECWNWRGGKRNHSGGYKVVYAPNHFNPTRTGWVREHRLIWEQVHNQPLPKGWVVHHLNDVKDDNRPENLYACSKEKHGALAAEHKKRIRALEAKILLLEKAMQDSQLMFNIGGS